MPQLPRILQKSARLSKFFSKSQGESQTTSNPQTSCLPNSSPTDAIISATLDLHVEPPPYTYKPLTGERNTRVLEVHGADSYDTILSFKLLEICLDSPPEYYAISYCWEGQTPSRKVLCEGRTLIVTANCEAALKQFRRQQDETILLWIDAICINQAAESVLERNHQVLMMGDVYATATQVKVWLGTDRLKPLRSEVLVTLKYLQSLGEVACKNGTEDEILKISQEIDLNGLTYMHLYLPWFNRAWVVQEVFLSKSAVMYRDEILIDYRGIIRAMTIISTSSESHTSLLPYQRILLSDFKMFYELESNRENLNARRIWIYAREFLSTDPRDKVFALNSILCAAGLALPHPDYTKDTQTVYREAIKAILLLNKRLTALKYITGLDDASRFSSWSPDLSQELTPGHLDNSYFKASGQSSQAVKFLNSDRLLACRGKILEMISACAGVALPYLDEKLGTPDKYLAWSRNLQPKEDPWIGFLTTAPKLSTFILRVWAIHVLRKFLSFISLKCSSSQEQADAYRELQDCIMAYLRTCSQSYSHIGKMGDWDAWRSMMEECLDESSTPNPVLLPDIPIDIGEERDSGTNWTAYKQKIRFRKIKTRLEHSKVSSILQTSEFKMLERISCNRSQAALHYVISYSIFYQTIFRTNSSNSLGMAPHSIREGDQVALLAGLDVPMIIRPLENGHFRMITPAYICGMMEGQAWDKAWEADGGKLLQDFIFE